jgi:hypothetical protein
MLSLGVCPEVPLKEARARRDAARKIVTAGGDPSRVCQEERDARATTFEGVAREWHTTRYAAKAPKTNAKVLAHPAPGFVRPGRCAGSSAGAWAPTTPTGVPVGAA